MKNILSAAAIAVAFVVSMSAQATTPQSQSPTTDQKSSSQKMSSKTVTLTGCLREGDTANTYKLENAEKSGKSTSGSESTASGSSSTSGSGTPTGTSAGMSDLGEVKLMASSAVSLKEHVGHRVQISGTWSGSAMSKGGSSTPDTTGSGSSASSSSATGTSGAKSNEQTLRVRSLKHISETCSK